MKFPTFPAGWANTPGHQSLFVNHSPNRSALGHRLSDMKIVSAGRSTCATRSGGPGGGLFESAGTQVMAQLVRASEVGIRCSGSDCQPSALPPFLGAAFPAVGTP